MSEIVLLSLPIGNLGDLTFRAKEILSAERIFIVEDTRAFRSFLQLNGIGAEGKRILSFHDASSDKKLFQLQELLEMEKRVCLLSEAGSPIISDPAYPLIEIALQNGHQLSSVPGVSSPIVALELSGLPPHPFHFHGFLPRTENEKREKGREIAKISGTHIFFESPNRVEDSLAVWEEMFPEARIAVARELTKKFETIYRFLGKEYGDWKNKIVYKGEFVLLINIQALKVEADHRILELSRKCLAEKGSTKSLAKLLAAILSSNSKEVYRELTDKGGE